MKKMIKKAEMGGQPKPKVKVTATTVTKKPAPSPKRTYPILPDEGDNYSETMKREKELKAKGMMKMGGKMKKAQLGMKSVKAGYDNNKGVTRADFVSIGTGEAKKGASMKKCKYGCK